MVKLRAFSSSAWGTALVAQARQLARHGRSGRDDVVGVHAQVDLQGAAVRVVGLERVHVVGQALLLADVHEQARCGPLAEDRC